MIAILAPQRFQRRPASKARMAASSDSNGIGCYSPRAAQPWGRPIGTVAKILWHVLRILAIVFLAAEPPAMATEATANLLINSGPDIDQDHAGLTAYPVPVDGSVSVASIDDWDISAYLTAADLTQQMIADAPPGLRHAMRYLIGIGAALGRPTDGFEIFQNLNPDQAAALGYGTAAPQTSCVAFYARSHAVTGNFGFAIKNGIASRGWTTTFNVPAADAWTTVTIAPIPGDSYGAGTSSATISATGTAGTNILTVGTTAGRAVGESVTAVGIPAGDFIQRDPRRHPRLARRTISPARSAAMSPLRRPGRRLRMAHSSASISCRARARRG